MHRSPAIASALLDDLRRRQLGVLEQRARCGLRIRPPLPIATSPSSGSSTSPLPVMISEPVTVGHRQHRLEPAQDAVGAPVLGQLHRRAQQIALVLVELRLEALEQRERIGRAAGEAGENAVVVQRRTLRALALTTTLPSVTWPSPPSATRVPRRTDSMVVP
jgi:hypothetical protein